MKLLDMLNHLLQSVSILLLLTIIAGCSDTFMEQPRQPDIVGDTFTVTGSVVIPDMPKVISRGEFGDTENADLKLTVFEFGLSDQAEYSFLTNIYNAQITTSTEVNNGVEVKFAITLKTSIEPRVLHLMVTDDELTSDYGSVATILSSLAVGDDQEAYWGYAEFPKGYCKIDENGAPVVDSMGDFVVSSDVVSKLTNIPVIRNFAKITVVSAAKNFDLKGFELVNIPDMGTVAPWDISGDSVPDLLTDTGVMKSYSDISYSGIFPGLTNFHNTEIDAKNWDEEYLDGRTGPRYIYEHPYESTRRTYLIIYGIYTYEAGSGKLGEMPCFYKIDIGAPDENNNNMFECYNIIRNIHYNVRITQVDAAGSETVEDAIAHAPFNNISASTETSSMLNISDGKNLLIVNNLNHIIVNEQETIEVMYRYIRGITGSQTEDNMVPDVVGLKKGSVIADFTIEPVDTVADGVNWKKIEIQTNPPTSDVKTQSFSIVDNQGLGRTINLYLRTPWNYEPIYTEGNEKFYATVARGDNPLYNIDDPKPEDISSASGAELTVYFNLPDGLAETMFPLYFQLESKNQWIENNKIGNLVVTSGSSLFDPNVIAISYIKKVSYEEYIYNYFDDGSNNLDINSFNTNHTVRCRFKTIMEVEGEPEAEIRIHNDYFAPDASVKFKRVLIDDAEEML